MVSRRPEEEEDADEEERDQDPTPPSLPDGSPRKNVIVVDFTKGRRIEGAPTPAADDDLEDEPLNLHLVFPPHIHTRMNTLRRIAGVKRHVDIIRRALAIYDVLIERHAAGCPIAYRDVQGVWIEIVMDPDRKKP